MVLLEFYSQPWHQTLHTASLSQSLPSPQTHQPGPRTSRTPQGPCVEAQKLYFQPKQYKAKLDIR